MRIHPCPAYEPDLSAFLDDELPPARRAEIDSHVAACDACRAALDQLRGVSRALRRWDAQETRYATSTGFRNRVLTKLGAAEGAQRSNFAWRAAAAVALVAAGATGFALVAPRMAPPPSAEVARLDAELKELKSRIVAPPVVEHETRDPAAAPAPVDRIEPLGPVVARQVPDEGSAAPAESPEVWEKRGEESFLRAALPDFSDFDKERRQLALAEEVRRLKEAPATVGRPSVAAAPASPLATFLGQLQLSSGNYPPFQQVQVWPLELSAASDAKAGGRAGERARLVPSEDAIAQEILSVTEGPVTETVVAVNNDPNRSVLVLAGDVLRGGRQDRVAREDVLVAPGQRLSIPTYTSGRSRPRTSYHTFTSSAGVAPPDIRALAAADRPRVSGGLSQAEFDAAVEHTVKALGNPGRLGSLDNLYVSSVLTDVADRYVKSFEKRLAEPGVVGFAVSAGDQILGIELFGDHASFLAHRNRVLRSYVLSALALDRIDGATPPRDRIAAIVAAAPKGAFRGQSQAGAGTLCVFRGVDDGTFGYGLLDDVRVLHAVLFTGVPAGVDAAAGRAGRRERAGPTAPLGNDRDPSGSDRGEPSPDDAVSPEPR